jgi:16S rRNA (guanine(966)-N(2))-methyltransferase RsmD
MRIISGASKGRKLRLPSGRSIRPTSGRVKESIFDTLGDEVRNKVVLDLFAGTGNLGIEALSRGAAKVVFVEKGRQALRIIGRNLLETGMTVRSEVLPKDAIRAIGILAQRNESFDLILMDPPYREGWVMKALERLRRNPIHHEGSLLVIEHDRRETLPDAIEGWEVVKRRKLGDTVVSFLVPKKPGYSPYCDGQSEGIEKCKMQSAKCKI